MMARKIGYWVCTGIIAFILLSGGLGQVAGMNTEGFIKLGYPAFFATMLGVWKILGGIAILVPRFPRVKEWAYAGIFFDFSSAAVTHVAEHSSLFHIISPLVCAGILFGSWALRPESRALGTLFQAKTAA
jgi:uncharacterized membrane protein YphA (DoxX/SURF4 family)